MNDGKDLDALFAEPVDDAVISHQDLTELWETSFMDPRAGPRETAESFDGLSEAVYRALRINMRVPRYVRVNRPQIRPS